MKGKIVFVIGGAKSGKSSFALDRAQSLSGRKAYIATAEPLDDEMKERIEKHKRQRGEDWDTFEEPLHIDLVLKKMSDDYSVVIIDCLTLWLSNLLLGKENSEAKMNDLVSSLKNCSGQTIFVVSNEVGMGIVPDNALSRMFRDLAGTVNQKMAELADEVYLVTAGIPIRIKP